MSRMIGQEKVIEEFNKIRPLSEKKPDKEFYDFILKNSADIKQIIIEQKQKDKKIKEFTMRIGFIHPLNSVIDERIRDLCCLKYRRQDGRMEPCGGIKYKRKACPPYSPKVEDTVKLLKQARVFLILQFENITDTIIQKYIHNFTVKAEKHLNKKGYKIIETYVCGPCRACAKGCAVEEECRMPNFRRFALESCGFWVNRICEKAKENTIYGDTKWDITWVKDYGFETQNPKKFKSVTGILIE